MKKYLIGLIAFTSALFFSAFNSKEIFVKESFKIYLVYNGGVQTFIGNYTQQSTKPASCVGSDHLCWICIEDLNSDGIIDTTEFANAFAAFDSNSNNTLDDENETGDLEKKA